MVTKRVLTVSLIVLVFAFIVGGITIGAIYDSLLKRITQPLPVAQLQEDVKGEDDEIDGDGEGDLSDFLPSDFPVYPDSTLLDFWSTEGEGGSAVSVVWESPDSLQNIIGFFREELADSNWEITNDFESSQSATLSFEKQKISGFLGVGEGETEKTAISVTLGKQ